MYTRITDSTHNYAVRQRKYAQRQISMQMAVATWSRAGLFHLNLKVSVLLESEARLPSLVDVYPTMKTWSGDALATNSVTRIVRQRESGVLGQRSAVTTGVLGCTDGRPGLRRASLADDSSWKRRFLLYYRGSPIT